MACGQANMPTSSNNENEKDKEMIFSLQFSEETGYCDNIQQMTGARDTYDAGRK